MVTIITALAVVAVPVHGIADSVVYDHFDDEVLDPAWSIILESAFGWSYSESGTDLIVTEIDPEVINHGSGGTWAIVKLDRTFFHLGNFNVDFDFSWDSEGSTHAMQCLYVTLYGHNNVIVARSGYYDPWFGTQGSKKAYIYGNSWTSERILPLSGNASIDIDRVGTEITILWNDSPILNGDCSIPVEKVQISFWYYAYIGGSFFGSESVDLLSVSGLEVPEDYFTGIQSWSGSDADPVNTATGSFFHQSTDLSITGRGSPLIFKRYYNSKAAVPERKIHKSGQVEDNDTPSIKSIDNQTTNSKDQQAPDSSHTLFGTKENSK
jgi:hypothetical protein